MLNDSLEQQMDERYAAIRAAALKMADDGIVGKTTFEKMVAEIQKRMNEFGAEILAGVCKRIDGEFDRRRDRHRVTQRNTPKRKRLMTALGEVTIERKLYRDKERGHSFYAVDTLLGIERYSRIEAGLKRKLIADATLTSYGKSSELNERCVSRQTVHNLVRRVGNASAVLPREGLREVDAIYIEADEDHIHLNTGRSAEVKLVYVHEGVRNVGKRRNELINVRYFTSCSTNADELWEEVYDYLFDTYRVSKAEIHLSGDGANWIRRFTELIPRVQFHLDKFHVYKSVTNACFGDRSLRSRIVNALKEHDYDRVINLYNDHYRNRTKRTEHKTIAEGRFYLENNFDSIELCSGYSCAAEGHVSHVLSSRMSSRPMGWSIAGAERIARLRAFLFNGGNFAALRIDGDPTAAKPKERNVVISPPPNNNSGVPYGRVVGRDGITDGYAVILRSLLKGEHKENF